MLSTEDEWTTEEEIQVNHSLQSSLKNFRDIFTLFLMFQTGFKEEKNLQQYFFVYFSCF